jgi:hypothetical protein
MNMHEQQMAKDALVLFHAQGHFLAPGDGPELDNSGLCCKVIFIWIPCAKCRHYLGYEEGAGLHAICDDGTDALNMKCLQIRLKRP